MFIRNAMVNPKCLSFLLMFTFIVLLMFTPAVEAITYGDINNDGEVDVNDVVLVMRHSLEIIVLSPSQQLAADVNNDGSIDVNDVVLIMRKALGIINEFPNNGSAAAPEDDDPSDGAGDQIILPSEPLYLYADDDTYLGKLTTNRFDSESIYNEFGNYGNPFSATSIWNEFGTYGSPFSNLSAFNDLATRPPHILTEDKREVGRLTTNSLIYKGIDPDDLEDALIAAGL